VSKHIKYQITTWQDGRDQKWHFIMYKFLRTTFKRSKRIGWHYMGWVKTDCDGKSFASRAEALAAARAARTDLLK
jgi:hypothetical protein